MKLAKIAICRLHNQKICLFLLLGLAVVTWTAAWAKNVSIWTLSIVADVKLPPHVSISAPIDQ